MHDSIILNSRLSVATVAAIFLLLSLARCDANGLGIILQTAVLLVSGVFAARQLTLLAPMARPAAVEPAEVWDVRALAAALLILIGSIAAWVALVVPALIRAHLG